jgi:type VI secretion system secreted protein Hcp
MALEAFLKLEGPNVDGESQRDQHVGELALSSYSVGLSNASDAAAGGGAAASIGHFQDLHFTMDLDRASPNLFIACAKGEHFTKATLVSRKVGGDTMVDYVKIEMDTVFVTSWQTGAATGSERAQLSGSLAFAKIAYTYTPQKEDGTADSEVGPKTFNIKTGQEE